MKERTLRILEFNKIKNKLRNYAVTSGGKELIDIHVRERIPCRRSPLEPTRPDSGWINSWPSIWSWPPKAFFIRWCARRISP